MNNLTADQFKVQEFGHLGLVAATIDRLGLVEKIDQLIPLEDTAKTTVGQRVKAMILNGLGFFDHRLYMFPTFLRGKPVSRLFGSDISHDLFNDDALGRGLDKVGDYGPTKLFCTLAMAVGLENNLLGPSSHIDTTTLSLYGEYPKEPEDAEKAGVNPSAETLSSADTAAIDNDNDNAGSDDDDELRYESEIDPLPQYGYAKNKRQDLRQMVMTLATTGKAAFPIWFEANSGNASDKKILLEASKKLNLLCKSIKDAPGFLAVGDSAMFDACIKEGGTTLWLTRVPETHGIAKDILNKPDSDPSFKWLDLGDGYKASYSDVRYKNIKQRWAVVFSEHAHKREMATLNRKIKLDLDQTQKDLWHLGNQIFKCEGDAERALKTFRKQLKLHDVAAKIDVVTQHKTKGRPKKGREPETAGYKITGNVTENKLKTGQMRNRKGRFILSTNQLDRAILPDDKILTEYKEQSKTESGFKFIKDNTFGVSSVFLKKPKRIAALMMIMTLSLMVYAFVQYEIRRKLQEAKETIPDQKDKPTDNPTATWVFKTLRMISIVKVSIENGIQEFVANLNDVCCKIIRLFGPEACKIYGVP